MNPTHLVLFDIDSTLLSAREEAWKIGTAETGDEVLMGEVELTRQVIRETLKIPVEEYKHRPSGKTDAQVVFELLEGKGYSDEEIYRWMPQLLEKYVERLGRVIRGPESARLMPGVPKILDALRERPELLLSILTGNCLGAALVKLRTFKLESYFKIEIGAYGDWAKHRDDLPGDAIEAAQRRMGLRFARKNVVVVGDTPSDIRCGRRWNTRTIAVATGSYPTEELKAENPDFLLPDLADTAKVLSAILDQL